jgi:hypothetical protein
MRDTKEVIRDGLPVDGGGCPDQRQQGTDLRRKGEHAAVGYVVEGTHSEGISGREQTLSLGIPDGKYEIALELIETPNSPSREGRCGYVRVGAFQRQAELSSQLHPVEEIPVPEVSKRRCGKPLGVRWIPGDACRPVFPGESGTCKLHLR